MDRLRESRGGVIAAQPHSSAVGACSSQAPATVDTDALLRRIAELEEKLKLQTVTTSVTEGKKQRTLEQIQAAKDRMAKARAGRKK
jgi:hypothetical protein